MSPRLGKLLHQASTGQRPGKAVTLSLSSSFPDQAWVQACLLHAQTLELLETTDIEVVSPSSADKSNYMSRRLSFAGNSLDDVAAAIHEEEPHHNHSLVALSFPAKCERSGAVTWSQESRIQVNWRALKQRLSRCRRFASMSFQHNTRD